MCRPWLKCYPTQTTQMLKVQTYRNIQIDTDVLCSSTLLGRRGWLRWESIKGMLCDRGVGFCISCLSWLSTKSKGSMRPKGRLMCQIPPPHPFLSPPSWYLTVRDSTERAEIDSLPHTEIGLVFHIGWYETFREVLVVGREVGVLCWGGGIGISGDDRMVMWG